MVVFLLPQYTLYKGPTDVSDGEEVWECTRPFSGTDGTGDLLLKTVSNGLFRYLSGRTLTVFMVLLEGWSVVYGSLEFIFRRVLSTPGTPSGDSSVRT